MTLPRARVTRRARGRALADIVSTHLHERSFPMLMTQTPATDWQAQLRAGDIVTFKFPLAERSHRLGKTRPCLVLAVADHAGVPHALVAYGTSADTPANRGHDLSIDTPDAMAAAGLHRPTRFVGARRVLVPLTSEQFRPRAETGSPLLGHLATDDRRALLDVLRAILREPAQPACRKRRRRPQAVGTRPAPTATSPLQTEGSFQ